MTALDMTANAEEMREIAADVTASYFMYPFLARYAERAEISPGLSAEIRSLMRLVEGMPRQRRQPSDFGLNYNLGRLLGHVSGLEDQLNADRACPESPTGWHEWANNEKCCHCGKDVP